MARPLWLPSRPRAASHYRPRGARLASTAALRDAARLVASASLGVALAFVAPLALVFVDPRGDPSSARAEPQNAAPERPGTQWFVSGPSRSPVLVYPPRDRGAPRPLVLHLHSYCWHPVDECPLMQPGAAETHWLLCPRATSRCANGGFSRAGGFSHGAGTAALVGETLDTFATAFPDDAREPAVLSGFSQGAYAAAKLAQSASPGRFAHLLLIAADVKLDPERLRRAGIRSVLLAAGESDGTRGAMTREAKRLEGLGYRAAFRSLGRIGHDFPPDMSDWFRGALAWFRVGEPAPLTRPRAAQARSEHPIGATLSRSRKEG